MTPKKSGWYWLAIALLMVGLVLYASEHDLPGLYEDHTENTQQLQTLGEKAQRLEREKLQLEQKITGLNSNSVVQESAIRKNTGHVRQGETIYRVELPEEK